MTVYDLIQELVQLSPNERVKFEVEFKSRYIECEHCSEDVEVVGEEFNMVDFSLRNYGGTTGIVMSFRGDI